MDTTLTLISPAKLNLFLHINGKRPPGTAFAGYHELQTVFQMLDRGDTLHFKLSKNKGISILPKLADIPDEDNLIVKAANALIAHQKSNSPFPGIEIKLEKNLPMGGGLGGGSSNAATTLLALNHLWQLDLDINDLADIGAQLGADVPIFVRGQSAWAEGIGDKITPIALPEHWYLILVPNCHINTGEIFSHQRLTRDTPKMKIAPALEGQLNKQNTNDKIAYQDQPDSDFLGEKYRNDCEALVSDLYPEIRHAIDWLSQFTQSRMTGTGACCFGRFNSEQEAQQVLNEASTKFKGFIAKGVNLSPAIQRLNEANCSQ
ncbi:MAG: 4-(cytidine 5'-diphospho)-2-C-methyl-D-erythritol kinase [Oleiphilus sp.]